MDSSFYLRMIKAAAGELFVLLTSVFLRKRKLMFFFFVELCKLSLSQIEGHIAQNFHADRYFIETVLYSCLVKFSLHI